MNRPRKTDRHLPPCVYVRRGVHYYVKAGKWRSLGRDQHAALVEYARIVSEPSGSMAKLIDDALPAVLLGDDGKPLADSTRAQYTRAAATLREVFVEFQPNQVRRGDVQRMLDAFAASPATANRLLTVLTKVFDWATARDLAEQNPCVKVKRLRQATRARLLAAGEYAAIYARAQPRLQCIMDLCAITGQRIGDVLSIRRAQLTDEGIDFTQQKGGKRLIVAWTPELREAVARAKALTGNLVPRTLFYSRSGQPPKYEQVWRAFKLAARRAGVENVRPHDLRAMAGTEADRQGLSAQQLLGHSDPRTTSIYLRDRTPKVVTPPTMKRPKSKTESR